jgi:hypothetical protein
MAHLLPNVIDFNVERKRKTKADIKRDGQSPIAVYVIMHAYQQGEMDATYLRCKIYEGEILVNITVRGWIMVVHKSTRSC